MVRLRSDDSPRRRGLVDRPSPEFTLAHGYVLDMSIFYRGDVGFISRLTRETRASAIAEITDLVASSDLPPLIQGKSVSDEYEALDLTAAIAALEQEATKYPGKRESFPADFALFGFATDVREHAKAVEALSTTVFPRAAFANARAAMESAVDCRFLVSEEKNYLFRGAQARVAELFEIEELEKRAAPLDPPIPPKSPPRMHPEDRIVEDAEAWDEISPGRGGLLRIAWERFTTDPGALRKHWSLLPKEEVYQTVFGGAQSEELGGMAEIIHALLSMASHPRMRVGSRNVEYTEEGGIILSTRPTDAEMARQITALACMISLSALQKRREFKDA